LSEADGLVEALGVPGTHPGIAAAADVVTSAVLTGDVETVRFAVAEFAVMVKTVSARIRSTHAKGS
jgi:hypothetical protein